jgi:integrase/recombinase XerD
MARSSTLVLSPTAQQMIVQYEHTLRYNEDLNPQTVRNYLGDLRHFAAWCEAGWAEGHEQAQDFTPRMIATPLVTQYRSYLQNVRGLQPATINRRLISLKRYFDWALEQDLIQRNPARVVKLVPHVSHPPRQLTDQEENALVTAVENYGSLRDQTLLLLALHTGLRAEELCLLQRKHLIVGERSGQVKVYGKRNKFRVVPLNRTARAILQVYLRTLPSDGDTWLFPSRKLGRRIDGTQRSAPIQTRALGFIVEKYAHLARVHDVTPHDLRHRFGYRMAKTTPLHRLAQLMGHDSLDTTMIYIRGTPQDLQQDVEQIAWQ